MNDLVKSFGSTVITEAKKFLGCKEDKGTPNRSHCVDKIVKMGGWTPTNEPWCAMYAYAVTDRTCKLFKVENKLPRTKSTRTMLNNASKNGIRVDRKPSKGCIFFIPRGNSGIYGHVGFVHYYSGNKIYTVEGNLSDQVKSGVRTINDDMRFIHIEEMTSKRQIATIGKIGGAILLATGAYYGAKKFF